MSMHRRRSAMVLGPALLALVLAAQPATAYDELKNTGTTAPYQVTDESSAPGVFCKYEQNSGSTNDELDRITVREFFSHGPYSQYTYVGFQVTFTRNTPPYNDNKYVPYHTTPVVKKKANDTNVAFYSTYWNVPENTDAYWRAVIKLTYYAQGSTSSVVGRAKGRLEVYKHNLSGESPYIYGHQNSPGYCSDEW